MELMQFRDYVFPHNPQKITVTEQGGVAVHLCPGAGDYVRRVGRRARIVRCEGSFFGKSCNEPMRQIELFRQSSENQVSGILYLPGLSPFPAHVKEFVFEAQGDGRLIPYTIVFVEEVI